MDVRQCLLRRTVSNPETSTREDFYNFMRLRTSTRHGIAERFGLDLREDKNESDFDRCKGWLMEARALGRLEDLLAVARDAKP
jgi:hypothetical protein